MVGQVFSLQIGSPVRLLTSWITWSMPWSKRYCSTTVWRKRSARGTLRAEEAASPLTLMGQPFTQLHVLGTGTQRQEVTLHIEGGIFLLKEVLGSIGVVGGGGVHGETRGEGRRVGHMAGGRHLGRRRRSRTSIVHLCGIVIVVVVLVVIASAKPLAAGKGETSRKSVLAGVQTEMWG